MSEMPILYEKDGEERWAVWSTVLEGILMYDADPEEVLDFFAERAEKRARRSKAELMIDIRHSDPGLEYDSYREDAVDQLQAIEDQEIV